MGLVYAYVAFVLIPPGSSAA